MISKCLFSLVLALGLIMVSMACAGNKNDPPNSSTGPEVFDSADRPTFQKDAKEDFKLLKPWNYHKSYNATRKYPLVVGLHGGGGSYYASCFVGNDQHMQTFPSFYMAPHSNTDWGSSATWLIGQIEELKDRRRIDPNRIYLVGFSMGGSGSYAVANAYYDQKKQLFAGIVRMAGQSLPSVRSAIAEKTSIWYHVGLEDTPERVSIARQAYDFIKSYSGNASAMESNTTDKTLSGWSRTTKTLTKNKVEIMKYSEYQGVGHWDIAFKEDSQVLKWLFDQSLEKR